MFEPWPAGELGPAAVRLKVAENLRNRFAFRPGGARLPAIRHPADVRARPPHPEVSRVMTQSSPSASDKAVWLRVLVVGAALVTVTFGIRQVFGLFVLPISNALGSGVQLVALAIAVQNLVWGFSSPFFGALADRIGAWKVAMLGAGIYTAGLLSSALDRQPVRRVSGTGADRPWSRKRRHLDRHWRGWPRRAAGPTLAGLRTGDKLRLLRAVRTSSRHADADERAWMAVGAADPVVPDGGDDGGRAGHAHRAVGRAPPTSRS